MKRINLTTEEKQRIQQRNAALKPQQRLQYKETRKDGVLCAEFGKTNN